MIGFVGRGQYLNRVLRLCAFSLFTVLVGNAVLLLVPQAREAIAAFDDISHHDSQTVAFTFAFCYWVVASWYCARLLLGRRFKFDVVGLCNKPDFARATVRWVPRILGLIAIVPITVSFARHDDHPSHWLGILVCSIVLIAFVLSRQALFGTLRQESSTGAPSWTRQGQEQFEHFDRLNEWATATVAVLLAIPVVVTISLFFNGVEDARFMGSPALVLTFLGGMVTYGSMGLIYFPLTRGLPRLIVPFCALVAVFSVFNENHWVGQRQHDEKMADMRDLRTAYLQWEDQRGNNGRPIIIVATAGGASRAALWTGLVLSSFVSPDGKKDLGDDIFAISSVSGGSVGAAAYVAALSAKQSGCIPPDTSTYLLMSEYLGRDWLSPVIGPMLFKDTLQKLWFQPIPKLDRSLGLEVAWENDWAHVLKGHASSSPCDNPFVHPLSKMYSAKAHLPALLLNSTAVNTGRRIVQTDLAFDYPETFDIFRRTNAVQLSTQYLTLSGAVHNTARFPYVSPAGLVFNEPQDGQERGADWDYLVDGGYYEDSATETATMLIKDLLSLKDPKDEKRNLIDLKKIFVIVIDNDLVTKPSESYCAAPDGNGEIAEKDSKEVPIDHASLFRTQGRQWIPEVTSPPVGLYETRSSRGEMAVRQLLDLVGGCGSGQFAEIHLPKTSGREIAMSWFLDSDSRGEMAADLKGGGTNSAPMEKYLLENMQRVRTTFLGMPQT
jgi:hypothetical protein